MGALTQDHKKLIRSNPVKAILGGFEHENEEVLGYALSVATSKQHYTATFRAKCNGWI